jgi:hypothetical protein
MFLYLFVVYLIMLSVTHWLWSGRPRGQSSSPGRVNNCLFSTSSIPILGPIQSPIQWLPGALSLGVKRPVHEADHLRLMPTSRKYVFIHPLPSTPSGRSA